MPGTQGGKSSHDAEQFLPADSVSPRSPCRIHRPRGQRKPAWPDQCQLAQLSWTSLRESSRDEMQESPRGTSLPFSDFRAATTRRGSPFLQSAGRTRICHLILACSKNEVLFKEVPCRRLKLICSVRFALNSSLAGQSSTKSQPLKFCIPISNLACCQVASAGKQMSRSVRTSNGSGRVAAPHCSTVRMCSRPKAGPRSAYRAALLFQIPCSFASLDSISHFRRITTKLKVESISCISKHSRAHLIT